MGKAQFLFLLSTARIIDADISKVAGSLTHWQIVEGKLSFGEQDIQDIENDYPRAEVRRVEFLRKWIAKNGNKANYVRMYTELEDLGEQGAADRIRELAGEQ